MDIGFTGTREGMAEAQLATLRRIIGSYWLKELVCHHGCCSGSDKQFHDLCRELGVGKIVGHPAFEEGHKWRGVMDDECDEVRPIEKPLVRNGHIVEESLILFATPKENIDEQRSGTWSTIRMSRKAGQPRLVIYPDGSIDDERQKVSSNRGAFETGARYGGV